MRRPTLSAALFWVAALGAAAGCGKAEAPPEAPAPPADQVQGPAGSIHVDDGGTGGVPVVLVHSFGGSSGHWAAQLAHLRTSRRALALDLRGHGRSAAPADSNYAIESLAADIAAVVDSLGLTGFVLVGAPGQTPDAQARQIMRALEANYDSVAAGYWATLVAEAQPEVRTRILQEMNSVPRGASLRLIRATFQYDPLPALRR